MKRNKFALQIIAFGLIVLSFIACDKDFANIESDTINNDNATNFDILLLTETYPEYTEVIAYTQTLGPVQTNGLGLNTLGIYDDLYGRTTSSFVTQVTASTYSPDFGDEVVIDSVVLKIPYFSVATEIEDDGNILYDIDSVLPRSETNKSIKLSLFESNFFIRDFNPEGDFNESQTFFSNKTSSNEEIISDAALEAVELIFLTGPETSYTTNANGEHIIDISDEGFVLTEPDNEDDDDTDPQILFREPPGLRIKLDPEYWKNKIIDQEEEAVLTSVNNFTDYFRGLYFKAELNPASANDGGSFLILNTGAQTSHITIYYTSLTPSTTDDAAETEQNTYQISFGANRINFMDNEFTTPIVDGNSTTGDSRIYLKGGEGSLGKIKLFNGDDLDDGDDMTFDDWKGLFVDTEEDGTVTSKRLVNEANLVFYVDQAANSMMQYNEPNRIYLYDIENKTPLVDYFLDNINNSIPSFSIFNHLGPLQRVDDEPTESGVKYKLKITDHINNLLLRDSTNVELGLSVSINVNLEELIVQREVKNENDSELTTPISSVITPRGTILHGNTTEDQSKKVYLEIYYTEPNN